MLQLKNKWLTVQVSEQGAEIVSIRNTEGQEYIWQADPQYWKRHAPVLFPIVGSLWNGQYVHQGQTYKMSQHGFARDMKFRLIQHTCDSITLRLNANEETKKNYPFDFQLDITYRLTTNRVTTTWEVTNLGDENMPFQIGGHPAFYIPATKETTWGYFQLTKKEHALHEMLCTPLAEKGCADILQRNTIALTDGLLPLTYKLFEKDALVVENKQIDQVTFLTADHQPYLIVRFDAPLVGFWTPAGKQAPFVCIEPWYGRCDRAEYEGEFSHRDWMNQLLPGATQHMTFSIEIA